MIVATRENIYGIDVFKFKNTHNVPYQLTFEKSLDDKCYEMALVNLLGKTDSKQCASIKQVICDCAFNHLLEKRKPLYFDMQLFGGRSESLIRKFIGWINNDSRVDLKIELTKVDDFTYLEFHISLKENYLKSLSAEHIQL